MRGSDSRTARPSAGRERARRRRRSGQADDDSSRDHLIETVRDLVVFGKLPNPLVCLWVLGVSAVTFWGGYWFFIRNRDDIADII